MSDVEKKRFADRLNALCDEKGIPPKGKARQVDLAKVFGVSQKGARKWLEGEGFPSTKKAIEIARWANVNYDWFMTGRGARHSATEPNQKTEAAMRLIEQMPEYKKDEAIKILTVLAEHQGKQRDGTNG